MILITKVLLLSNDSGSRAQVGRVISRFISSKWQCQGHVLQHNNSGLDGDSVSSVLEQAMEDMTIGSGSSDIAIFQALLVIAPQIAQHAPPAKIPQFLDLAWQKLMEEKKNILFWKKLESLIPLGLHKSLMQHEDPEVEEGMKEFMQKLWTLGSEKTGITFLMFDHICGHILKDDPDRRLATKWTSLLLDACAFGNVHKKGERLWLDVCAYIESLGPALAVNEITSSVSRNDLFTRVIILNWLSSLRPNVTADHMFVVQFTDTLWSQYLELAALTTYKQFSNSLSHRQKHRMVSVLLLLADFITEESSKQYMPLLWHALELECHPSVRQNLEWMVMRIIIAFPSRVSTVWDVFKQYENKRSVCLCSLFLVLSHLGVFLPVTVQAQYYIQAFTCVIPWTMAHHYNTRIFAQTTMMRMWQQCQTLGLADVLEKFSVVQASLDFLCNNGNASNTSVKLIRNYMYCGLNPLRDYSMETIFHTLPRLASLADDEWVLPQQFVQWDKAWEDVEKHHLPLGNSSGELAQCKEGPWRMKAHVENEEDISESADGDVQKKIMPWRQMSPDQETEAELASQRRKKAEGGVIVVTSLIDKIPNLGGLCRTSEIFGVSEFVIGNLTHLGDKMFQNLSVSAQKWINITEVMRPRLIEFLEEKRLAGYTLVGVEQTANSVSLEEYQFPKKTLLLLGNEKEGIPVDIIQLLDVCVEIPQLGIIRSLNVHVCGALIVWEYTRQQMRLQQQSS
ncbi:probable methyltransferase TARBP1 [Aplysia californica]|uniref:Probable methyltransferase TARBP1 n=1 Tax=Aplysia californica TaxID=6500 RepID=A0ABM1AE75_APLCA|nr:probable methyltransferase TARBP1 [Aplysia californica]